MKKSIIILSLFISAFLVSCEKEQIGNTKFDECNNILSFQNYQEIASELDSILGLTLEQKKQWQKNRGFTSFGVLSEEFYEGINPDQFKDTEDVFNFVQKNSRYLTLVQENGEYAVMPKFYNNPLRYIMNEDCVFQIRDKAFKVLTTGRAYSNMENIEQLMLIDDVNVDQLCDGGEITFNKNSNPIFKSASCGNGDSNKSEPIKTGKKTYRTTIELRCDYFDDYIDGTIVESYYNVGCQVRTLGIWWGHKTTLYSDVTTTIEFHHRSNGIVQFTDSETYTTPSLVKNVERWSFYNADFRAGHSPYPEYVRFNCKGWSDAGVSSTPNSSGQYAGLAQITCQ
jgi:hypothetical protein